MTSTMWGSIARIKSFHHSAFTFSRLPLVRRENVKDQIARLHLIRKANPAPRWQERMLSELNGRGLPGWSQYVFRGRFYHIVLKIGRTGKRSGGP
jgi:hypothetical protein